MTTASGTEVCDVDDPTGDGTAVVVVGVDEYGQPEYARVPRDTAAQWDQRVWSGNPLG